MAFPSILKAPCLLLDLVVGIMSFLFIKYVYCFYEYSDQKRLMARQKLAPHANMRIKL